MVLAHYEWESSALTSDENFKSNVSVFCKLIIGRHGFAVQDMLIVCKEMFDESHPYTILLYALIQMYD